MSRDVGKPELVPLDATWYPLVAPHGQTQLVGDFYLSAPGAGT
ncbi:MAG TPA: hypothetical protein VFV13_15095 [Acidimicrobiia bacterium]|nr:hypothetical protein [Acidimicrobiia bacterium]